METILINWMAHQACHQHQLSGEDHRVGCLRNGPIKLKIRNIFYQLECRSWGYNILLANIECHNGTLVFKVNHSKMRAKTDLKGLSGAGVLKKICYKKRTTESWVSWFWLLQHLPNMGWDCSRAAQWQEWTTCTSSCLWSRKASRLKKDSRNRTCRILTAI